MATKAETINEANEGHGCLGKERADEPIFILRAQDRFAPEIIEAWATKVAMVKGAGVAADKVRRARALAHEMRAWQELNISKIPD